MSSAGSIDLSATIAEASDELRRSLGPARPVEGDSPEEADIRIAAARLVESLLALGRVWPGDEQTRRRLVLASVAHGRLRRDQGEAEDVLFRDYDHLRATIWERIRTSELAPGIASDVILGLDAAIGLAVAASLRGFYQDVIARSGGWPLTIERLVWEWLYHADPHDS